MHKKENLMRKIIAAFVVFAALSLSSTAHAQSVGGSFWVRGGQVSVGVRVGPSCYPYCGGGYRVFTPPFVAPPVVLPPVIVEPGYDYDYGGCVDYGYRRYGYGDFGYRSYEPVPAPRYRGWYGPVNGPEYYERYGYRPGQGNYGYSNRRFGYNDPNGYQYRQPNPRPNYERGRQGNPGGRFGRQVYPTPYRGR